MTSIDDYPTLFKFFREECNLRTFAEFTSTKNRNDDRISLTLLEYFVSRYAKQNNVRYKIRMIDGSERMCYVADEYSAALNAHTKSRFDPFARRTKLALTLTSGDLSIETSIGQLNFFKWAISNGVIDYITENINDIRMTWTQFQADNKQRKVYAKTSR